MGGFWNWLGNKPGAVSFKAWHSGSGFKNQHRRDVRRICSGFDHVDCGRMPRVFDLADKATVDIGAMREGFLAEPMELTNLLYVESKLYPRLLSDAAFGSARLSDDIVSIGAKADIRLIKQMWNVAHL